MARAHCTLASRSWSRRRGVSGNVNFRNGARTLDVRASRSWSRRWGVSSNSRNGARTLGVRASCSWSRRRDVSSKSGKGARTLDARSSRSWLNCWRFSGESGNAGNLPPPSCIGFWRPPPSCPWSSQPRPHARSRFSASVPAPFAWSRGTWTEPPSSPAGSGVAGHVARLHATCLAVLVWLYLTQLPHRCAMAPPLGDRPCRGRSRGFRGGPAPPRGRLVHAGSRPPTSPCSFRVVLATLLRPPIGGPLSPLASGARAAQLPSRPACEHGVGHR